MKPNVLSATHLWQRRSDMLFMAWNPNSPIQREVDWYLNFGISKGLRYQTTSLTSQQTNLLNEVGLDIVSVPKKGEQLICLAPPHFFCRHVVVSLEKNASSFSKQFLQFYHWLKPSRASTILPTSVPVEDFQSSLQKLGFDKEIFITVDVVAAND